MIDDRYRLVDRLGRGSTAEVWRCVDLRLQRNVAMKIFRPDAVDCDRLAPVFALMGSVWTPGMARMLDAGTDLEIAGTRHVYVVTELVNGRPLSRLAETGVLSLDELAGIGATVATTLAGIHVQGAAHGGLTAASVLVTAPTDPFDRAGRRYDGQDAVLVDLGTAQLLGRRPAGAADDIHDLGVLLLQAATGRRVLGGRTAQYALDQLARRPRVRGKVRRAWVGTIAAMLHDDRTARPSAAAAAAALSTLHSGLKLPSPSETAAAREAAAAREVDRVPGEILFGVE